MSDTKDEASGLNIGSLLRLFKSEDFSTWMLISYLYKFRGQGAQDYLCNMLYLENDDDVEFYLPQLCNLLIFHEECTNLHKYLMDKSSSCVHFGLKISWMFAAMTNTSSKSSKRRCNELRETAELASLNCRRDFSPESIENLDINDFPEGDFDSGEDPLIIMAEMKKKRCDYFIHVRNFVERLATIGDELRYVKVKKRKKALKEEIKKLNDYLKSNPAMYIPLSDASDQHQSILRIAVDESIVLNSRDRAPFLIFMEVLDTGVENSVEDMHYIEQCRDLLSEVTADTDQTLSSEPEETEESEDSEESEAIDHDSQNNTALDEESGTSEISGESDNSGNLESPSQQSEGSQDVVSPAHAIESEEGQDSEAESSGEVDGASVDDWVELPHQNLQRQRSKSVIMVRETLNIKKERIRATSPYGKLPGWNLTSVIVKFGDDCRQERLALQLISQFKRIWDEADLPLYLRPYHMLVLAPDACIIETITDAMSIHQLKKDHQKSLLEYFSEKHGGEDAYEFEIARRNFVESLAAYSIVTYILQLKDRHNGNIMVDFNGHIIHIDFGFMLWNSPGSLNWEKSPFKLTQEYVDFMGGVDSGMYAYFSALCLMGFLEVRKHSERIIGLVNLMLETNTKLPCLLGGKQVVKNLKQRFAIGLNDLEMHDHVDGLIKKSLNNWRTSSYDEFQHMTNGIEYQ
eukprot:TRINITY_DN11751_c0_g1_i1.p1 TRINITY_DN11751_c0_g1~~TRINITY_DN11751_c0_g1_i1.p1  ORF type:complete len:689 (-),score=162.46 TRINITY_DN11751_c0_g1_i1:1322-3388(-)